MKLSATDPLSLSGVAAILYRIDGGAWQTSAGADVVVTGSGSHTVDYLATDQAGNYEKRKATTFTIP